MRTVRAIAFRGQFEACTNAAFELHFGLRHERWDAGGGGAIGLYSKHSDKSNESVTVSGSMLIRYRVAVRVGAIKVVYLRTHHYKHVARCR